MARGKISESDDVPLLARPSRRRQKRQLSGRETVLVVVVLVVGVVAAYKITGGPGGQASSTSPAVKAPPPVTSCNSFGYPASSRYRFEYCSEGAPVAWPHCSEITISENAAHAPAGWQADVSDALRQLSAATGLRFTVVTGHADMSLSWDPSLYRPAPGTSGEVGKTRPMYLSGLGGAHLVSAEVLISSHLTSGSGRIGEEPVLLHELGHAVGLGHYQGAEVMNPVAHDYDHYQPGDLAGFAYLYAPSSCGHQPAG